MSSLQDDMALATLRTSVNAPRLAFAPGNFCYGLAQSIISHVNDGKYLVSQSAVNIAIATAQGPALDILVANYGISRFQGTPAIASVVFSLGSAATSTVTIPAGTLVGTVGDGVVTKQVAYILQNTATIAIGNTTSGQVLVQATTSGVIGNVIVGAITIMITIIAGVSVNNTLAVDGTNGTILGLEPWQDGDLRRAAYAVLYPKYSTAQLAAQGLTASYQGTTPWDLIAVDPQDGTGNLNYYWCDVNGNTPGLTVHAISSPSLAATIDTAIRAVLPPNITPTATTLAVTNLTGGGAIAANYYTPAAIGTSLEPAMKTAIAAYFQTLLHNQTPTTQGAVNYMVGVAAIVGFSNFAFTTVFSAPGATGIYRCTGVPSSVVALTRLSNP